MTPKEGVLLDTSAWIAFFSPMGHVFLKQEVRRALQEEQIHVCPVVISELLVGARDGKAFARLADLLGALSDAPITQETWRRAADLGFSLRRKGYSIPLLDLLIAATCREGSLDLWHLDEHFEAVAQYAQIRTRSFL